MLENIRDRDIAAIDVDFDRLLEARAFLTGTSGKLGENIEEAMHARDLYQDAAVTMGAVLKRGIWLRMPIDVCWEDGTTAHSIERGWVEDAIRRSWVGASAVDFAGWGICDQSSRGIRIRWSDEGPHVKRLGSSLDGMPDGMVLNATFQNWSPACASTSFRETCIRGIAVHEFGHALAFAHEQNRDDTPAECKDERQGDDPDWYLTIFDTKSVMYYCNPRWVDGILSAKDVESVRKLYGLP